MPIKIYFAGPDVFRPDYESVKRRIRQLCIPAGAEAIFPDDNNQTDPLKIFLVNVGLIRKADGVIANLNPFRSETEPDSGTAFECGLAFALGKKVIGYMSDLRPMVDKFGGTTDPKTQTAVENFDQPANLMLVQCTDIIVDSVEAAILTVCKVSNMPSA